MTRIDRQRLDVQYVTFGYPRQTKTVEGSPLELITTVPDQRVLALAEL